MPGSAVVDIRSTYGIAFIGLIFSTFLNGVTIIQTWIYYGQYRGRDPMSLKAFIAILVSLDTLHTILCGHAVYWYLVLNFGNIENLGVSVWSLNTQIGVNGTVGYLVQLFYARRVYFLSKNTVVPTAVAIIGGIAYAHTIVFVTRLFALVQFSRFASLKWVASVALVSGSAADILIAVAMCWYLYQMRTGFSRMDSMISTLMTYSVNSGLLTSILATCALVTFLVNPAKDYHLADAFYWLMGKCYVNSFLAILNNRDNIRALPTNTSPSSAFQLESVRPDRNSHKSKTDPNAVTVTVHRTTTGDFAMSESSCDNEQGLAMSESEGVILSSQHHVSPTLVSSI